MEKQRKGSGRESFKNVIGFTWQRWTQQPVRTFAVAMCALLAAMADVLTPRYAGQLIDALSHGGAGNADAWHAALWAFGALTALGLAGTLLRQGAFRNIITLTLRMMSEVVGESFHRVQRFSTDWHANSFAGSTVRKITRGMGAIDLLNDTLLVALFPALVMLVGATVLLGMHWAMMGVVVGVGSVLYIVVTVCISLGYVAPAGRLTNLWDTRMGGALADAISCNPVVKAFGAERREDGRLLRVIGKWNGRTRRTWHRATTNGGVQGGMLVLMQGGIIGTAMWLWQRGEASVGDVTFALTMFFILKGHLREVGMHVRNVQRSVNDMEEMVALYEQPLGIADKAGAQPIVIDRGDIRFEDMTFHYGARELPLYANLNLHIAPGERVGLVGHSGSGKTTLVKLIQRLYDISGGRITIDGQDIAEVQQSSLRAQIAIVQQEPLLFHRSLAENIAYAKPTATRAEIERAAELANAHEFIVNLPKGYDTLVGERGVKLSGGERQRVAIARAFLADAAILIFDEATSSLDSESEVLIQEAMERLMVGRTTIVIAHRLSTVRALDRLLVIDHGRVIEEGTHDKLIRRDGGVYRRLFERQALELTKGLTSEELVRVARLHGNGEREASKSLLVDEA